MPRYNHTCDVQILLNHFQKLENNKHMKLKELTKKLCALLLLTAAQRVQTIYVIKLSCIKFQDSGCDVLIVDKFKHSRPGRHQSSLHLPRHVHDQKLCVVDCLSEYISRTENLRKDTDQLLVCYNKPFQPASEDSIARWLREVLQDADIDNFACHSFRAASASAMLRNGVPEQRLLLQCCRMVFQREIS